MSRLPMQLRLTSSRFYKREWLTGYDFTLKLPDMNDSVETIEQLVESNKKIKIQKVVQSVDSVTRGIIHILFCYLAVLAK